MTRLDWPEPPEPGNLELVAVIKLDAASRTRVACEVGPRPKRDAYFAAVASAAAVLLRNAEQHMHMFRSLDQAPQ